MMGLKRNVLMPSVFFGPVYYYHKVVHSGIVFIEGYEHYLKQTYRNRCMILGANGPMPLIVPVEDGRRPQQPIRDTRIAYHTPWHRNHWRSIVSAYRNSPFFDYYAPDIEPFFRNHYTFLFDYNLEIFHKTLELLHIRPDIRITSGFETTGVEFDNFREAITPKLPFQDVDKTYRQVPYTQVFEDKFPFVPDLSILDLLFCKGNEALEVLKES